MEKTRISVNDYYGRPEYYPVMPESIFDALERAFLEGEETAEVDRDAFGRMVADFSGRAGR